MPRKLKSLMTPMQHPTDKYSGTFNVGTTEFGVNEGRIDIPAEYVADALAAGYVLVKTDEPEPEVPVQLTNDSAPVLLSEQKSEPAGTPDPTPPTV